MLPKVTGNSQVLIVFILSASAVIREQKMQIRELFRALGKTDCKKCKKILDDAGVT
jgi:hypothetical protein